MVYFVLFVILYFLEFPDFKYAWWQTIIPGYMSLFEQFLWKGMGK